VPTDALLAQRSPGATANQAERNGRHGAIIYRHYTGKTMTIKHRPYRLRNLSVDREKQSIFFFPFFFQAVTFAEAGKTVETVNPLRNLFQERGLPPGHCSI